VGKEYKGEKVMDTFIMTQEEVEALMKELKYQFISYENPIAVQVVNRMMQFLRSKENAGKS